MTKKGKQGVSPEKIRHVRRVLDDTKAQAKVFTDTANETVSAFGDDGGHTTAIKNAVKLSRLEPAEFLAHWRALEHYCDVLGLFDQQDMLDETPRRFAGESASVN